MRASNGKAVSKSGMKGVEESGEKGGREGRREEEARKETNLERVEWLKIPDEYLQGRKGI